MVMIMKLKSLQWINQQPTMNNATPLHQFYKQKQIHIPTIKELIIDKIRFESYVYDTLFSRISDDALNQEIMEIKELCKMIGLDYDELPHWNDSGGWKKLGYNGKW